MQTFGALVDYAIEVGPVDEISDGQEVIEE